MECGCRLSIQFWRSVIIFSILYDHIFIIIPKTDFIFQNKSLCNKTTEESVYIIGGWTADPSTGYKTPIIAEYKNDVWYNVGSLNQSRHAHGAITSGAFTMVIEGSSADGQP